jgi:hypothetical protein
LQKSSMVYQKIPANLLFQLKIGQEIRW